MAHPARWKYDIHAVSESTDGHPRWRVGVRPFLPGNLVLFSSENIEDCKLWIEAREREGGYACAS